MCETALLTKSEIDNLKKMYSYDSFKVYNSQEEIDRECNIFNFDVDFKEKIYDELVSFKESVFLGDVYFFKA